MYRLDRSGRVTVRPGRALRGLGGRGGLRGGRIPQFTPRFQTLSVTATIGYNLE